MNSLLLIFVWICIVAANIVLFAYLSAKHKTYAYLFAALSTYIVLANIIAFRIMYVGPFVVPVAIVVYSLTFLITDFLSEKYGRKVARKAVLSGFIINVLAVIVILFSNNMPYPSFASEQAELFAKTFSFTSRIVLGSLVAYIISQNVSVTIYHVVKVKTKGKKMWLRNNLSTSVAQLVDTIIFISMAFYGVFPLNALKSMIISQYIIKLLIALIDTPFLYLSTYIFDKFNVSKPQ